MDFGELHGRHGKPKVWRSESDLRCTVSRRQIYLDLKVEPEARVPEEIPGSPHGTSRLDDGIVIVRQLGLNAVGRVDTRYASPNDEHIEVGLLADFGIYRTHDGGGGGETGALKGIFDQG